MGFDLILEFINKLNENYENYWLTGSYIAVPADYNTARVVGHTSDCRRVDVLSVLIGTERQIH